MPDETVLKTVRLPHSERLRALESELTCIRICVRRRVRGARRDSFALTAHANSLDLITPPAQRGPGVNRLCHRL